MPPESLPDQGKPANEHVLVGLGTVAPAHWVDDDWNVSPDGSGISHRVYDRSHAATDERQADD